MRISDWSSDVCSSDLFYVRIIERPQSTVDSNLINQRESQRIIDECCVEILVPIMGRRVLQLPIDDAIVGRGDHLHVLQRAREPIDARRSEEHTSELQSLMRHSYAVFCLKKKIK